MTEKPATPDNSDTIPFEDVFSTAPSTSNQGDTAQGSTAPGDTGTRPTEPLGAAPAAASASREAQAAPASAAANPTRPRLRVRVGTIVWGAILLLIAALTQVMTLVDPAAYTPSFVLWSVIGFGGLLVIAGLVGAVVRASTRPRA